jgi:hypothetical protein
MLGAACLLHHPCSVFARLPLRTQDSREARITELGTQLTHYWHRLNTPEEEQRAFLEQHAGISDAIFEVVRARCIHENSHDYAYMEAGARGSMAYVCALTPASVLSLLNPSPLQVEAAIARMRDEFTSRLTELVAKARTAISAAWDEMRAGPQQRAEMFPAFMVEGAWRHTCTRKR